MRANAFGCVAVLAILGTAPGSAHAAAVLPGVFNSNTLAGNDDGSTGLVALGFGIDFYGSNYSQVYVNNNGNITFTNALGIFTPFGLLTAPLPIIAPFFADVDTRDAAPDVTYGTGTYDGRNAFGVNWLNVDHFATSADQTNRNTFQLVLVDRGDTGVGNFDFIFNYDQIQWEAGEASGSSTQGCGGASARVGYTNGGAVDFEFAGSGVNGAFLDSGNCLNGPPNAATALVLNSLNSDVAGRYVFQVRNGAVVPQIPEPATMLLLGVGAYAALRRRSPR